jgi:hypothetical protein
MELPGQEDKGQQRVCDRCFIKVMDIPEQKKRDIEEKKEAERKQAEDGELQIHSIAFNIHVLVPTFPLTSIPPHCRAAQEGEGSGRKSGGRGGTGGGSGEKNGSGGDAVPMLSNYRILFRNAAFPNSPNSWIKNLSTHCNQMQQLTTTSAFFGKTTLILSGALAVLNDPSIDLCSHR